MGPYCTLDPAAYFKVFVKLCQEDGLLDRPKELFPKDESHGFSDPSTLLRFFYAKDCNPEAAFHQLKESTQIRNDLASIRAFENIDLADYTNTRHMYPHWTGRRDKRGLPICFFDISSLNSTTISDYRRTRETGSISTPADPPSEGNHEDEDTNSRPMTLNATQRAFVFHDNLTRFVLPLCEAALAKSRKMNGTTPHVAADGRENTALSAVYIVDVSSLGLKQAWDLRTYAQDISKLLAISYPEVIDSVYVLNTPTLFHRAFSLLRKYLDPRTASKLRVIPSNQVLSTLQQTIELRNIPTQFGGQLEFTHGQLPRLEEELVELIEWKGEKGVLPDGPVKWTVDERGVRKIVVVGRVAETGGEVEVGRLRR